jgi:hypothetical protein
LLTQEAAQYLYWLVYRSWKNVLTRNENPDNTKDKGNDCGEKQPESSSIEPTDHAIVVVPDTKTCLVELVSDVSTNGSGYNRTKKLFLMTHVSLSSHLIENVLVHDLS